jgi:hypothetical protein
MKMSNKEFPQVPKMEKPDPIYSTMPLEYEVIEITTTRSVRPWYLFNKDKERVPDECFHSGNEKQ